MLPQELIFCINGHELIISHCIVWITKLEKKNKNGPQIAASGKILIVTWSKEHLPHHIYEQSKNFDEIQRALIKEFYPKNTCQVPTTYSCIHKNSATF